MAVGIDRLGALKKAFEFVYKSEVNGVFAEFGVYQGMSFSRALKVNETWQQKTKRNHIVNFVGFDSFEGLPTFTKEDFLETYEVFKEGQFSETSVDKVLELLKGEGCATENVHLIPGLFSETLEAPKTLDIFNNQKVAIAHIDCDLYSSAVDCLNFLETRFHDGAVLLFDDWFCYRGRSDRGVHKATLEWLAQSQFKVSEYFNYSWAGKAFIVNAT